MIECGLWSLSGLKLVKPQLPVKNRIFAAYSPGGMEKERSDCGYSSASLIFHILS